MCNASTAPCPSALAHTRKCASTPFRLASSYSCPRESLPKPQGSTLEVETLRTSLLRRGRRPARRNRRTSKKTAELDPSASILEFQLRSPTNSQAHRIARIQLAQNVAAAHTSEPSRD